MCRLRKEIKLFMPELHRQGQELTARFCFSKDFVGFKGHFPGKPILPGVCKIQAILCMLEEATQKTPQLREIDSAKFFAPVTYDQEIACKVRQELEVSRETRISALFINRDAKVAEIKLKVVFEG